MNKILSASILSSNIMNLKKEIKILNNSNIDYIHVDIMDGNFVKNISFGFNIIKLINNITNKSIDLHLMIKDLSLYYECYYNINIKILYIHIEHINLYSYYKLKKIILKKKIKLGIVINPNTNINIINKYIFKIVDIILIMGVYPGFSGQKMLNTTYNNILKIKHMISKFNIKKKILFAVDGGININNILTLKKHGIKIFICGSSIFNKNNIIKTINIFKSIIS